MKDTVSALIFILFIYTGFLWTKVSNDFKEHLIECNDSKREYIKQLKQRDSVNTTNIQNNKLLTNRIEIITERSRKWKK